MDVIDQLRERYVNEINESKEQLITIEIPHNKGNQYSIYKNIGDLVSKFLLARLYNQTAEKVIITVSIE